MNDKLYIGVGCIDPMMSYITTWTDHICVIPPGNYDESTLTAALNTLSHGLDLSLSVSTDASKIMSIHLSDYHRSFRKFTDHEVIKNFNVVKNGVIYNANTSGPQSIN